MQMSRRYNDKVKKTNTERDSRGSDTSLPNYVTSCTDSGISSSDSLINGDKRASDGVVLDLVKLTQKTLLHENDKSELKSDDDLLYYKIMESGKQEKNVKEEPNMSTEVIPRTSVFLTAMDSQINKAESDNDSNWADCTSVSTESLNIENEIHNTAYDPEIICQKCNEIYKDPRLLPCLHTFCLRCLQHCTGISKNISNISLDQKNAGRNISEVHSPTSKVMHSTARSTVFLSSDRCDIEFPTITCHVCNMSANVPSSGISGFPVNEMMRRQIVLNEMKDCSVRSLSCDLCCDVQSRPSPMQGRCIQCSMNLCQFCIQAHKRQKPTASHLILDLEEIDENDKYSLSTDSIPMLCNKHPFEELKLYCSECNVLVCRDCCLCSEHFSHSHKNVYQKCESKISAVKENISQLEETEKDIKTIASEVSKQVERHIDGYIRGLQDHKKKLLNTIQVSKRKKISAISEEYKALKNILNKTEYSCSFTTKLLGAGTEGDILSSKEYLMKNLQEVAKMRYRSTTDSGKGFIEFYPKKKTKVWLESNTSDGSSNVLSQSIQPRLEVEIWGVVVSNIPHPNYCVAYGDGLKHAEVKLPTEFFIHMKTEDQENLNHGGDNVSVRITPESTLCKRLPKVQVVDKLDGTYRVLYIVYSPGMYNIEILVSQHPIKGSPFRVTANEISVNIPHTGIFHCCTFCSSGGSKTAICACGSRMPGGYSGCGHGHSGHPGLPHWSCCGQTNESASCLSSLPLFPKLGLSSQPSYHTLPTKLHKARRHQKNLSNNMFPSSPTESEDFYGTPSTIKAQSNPYFNINNPYNSPTLESKSNVKTVSL